MKGDVHIAIYHFNVKIVSRGKGASAVAKAAYISGEKIKNEYDGVMRISVPALAVFIADMKDLAVRMMI